jgi:cysteine sulfinate desulfinase/cysteine desulfurase-like protein
MERRSLRLVPKGGGYQERDARFSTLDPEHAVHFVAAARERSKALMQECANDIETYGW